MESNRSDNRSNRSERQAERSQAQQSRSNRVEFANELNPNAEMDKKCDNRSERSNKNSR